MDNNLKEDFDSVIQKTKKLLNDNDGWRGRYTEYQKKISANIAPIEGIRGSFHEWSPLYVYLNTTSVKNAKASVNYELRYMGQTVAVLKGNNDHRHMVDTRNYE
jgi:hypothetical protein